MQPEIVQAVGERWVWILDIVFGSVIGFGFQKLEEGLRLTAKSSVSAFMKHLFMAAGFLGFVIYDIGVYHILIKNFPYDVSSLSAARYVLDLIMAFLLRDFNRAEPLAHRGDVLALCGLDAKERCHAGREHVLPTCRIHCHVLADIRAVVFPEWRRPAEQAGRAHWISCVFGRRSPSHFDMALPSNDPKVCE